MKVYEYLRKHNTLILYKVLSGQDTIPEARLETRRIAKEASRLIRISYKDTIDLYKKASAIIFDSPKKYAVKTSEINEYTWGTKVVDIAIIGMDAHSVELEYIRELKKSDKIKKELLRYLYDVVTPTLNNIFGLKNVVAIGHRGSLTIPTRKATPLSDIDIFILLSDDNRQPVIELLKKAPGRISVLDISDNSENKEKILKQVGRYKINFDLIPEKQFVEAYNNRLKRIDYYTYMFEFIELLMTKKRHSASDAMISPSEHTSA